jgi:hypothetical protein
MKKAYDEAMELYKKNNPQASDINLKYDPKKLLDDLNSKSIPVNNNANNTAAISLFTNEIRDAINRHLQMARRLEERAFFPERNQIGNQIAVENGNQIAVTRLNQIIEARLIEVVDVTDDIDEDDDDDGEDDDDDNDEDDDDDVNDDDGDDDDDDDNNQETDDNEENDDDVDKEDQDMETDESSVLFFL